MKLISQIIISGDFASVIEELRDLASDGERFETIIKEDRFLLEDAALAIEKAYLASAEKIVIVMAAKVFPTITQNKLLKIIEEPPPNKEFIIINPSKSSILPTIRSRLPVVTRDDRTEYERPELDLDDLDIRSVYDFVQKNIRVDAGKAKEDLEYIVTEAIRSGQYDLDEKSLDMFQNSMKALNVGSPPSFVLTGVLLKLLARKTSNRAKSQKRGRK